MNLEERMLQLLEEVGIKAGQVVLDFGCGSGTYAIPAARIVGDKGKVYALDKDSEVLNELMQKAQSAGLNNIDRVDTHGELRIHLADGSVDVVFLFDVFHFYYFPKEGDIRRLIGEIYRIMKPSAFLSVWPKHMGSETEDEIKKANFHLEKELSGVLIHENKDLEKGKVLNFRKDYRSRDER